MTINSQEKSESEPPGNEVHQAIADLKEAIWNRRPVLGDIMRKHGDKILHDYTQDFLDVNKSPVLDARKNELIDTTRDLLKSRLGNEVAEGVARQLRKLPLVSTADHHGPIDHPFWINSNIISGIPFHAITDPDIRYLIAFSFASVSLNNSSQPRGFGFHGGLNGSGNLIKLSLLPDKLKMGVVYGMRAFTKDDVQRVSREVEHREKLGTVIQGKGSKVREVIDTFYHTPEVLDAPDFASQTTIINHRLWPHLFKNKTRENIEGEHGTSRVPDLIYLEIETLVSELLIRYHLNDPSTLIHRLIFNPTYRTHALKYFNNIAGAFSLDNKWGTYLFWARDPSYHRVRLSLNTTHIFSSRQGYEFALEPQTIAQALKEKKIFPSMLLCYLVVSLYYGMKCLGGFSQVHDLTITKRAWKSLLEEVGEESEAQALEHVQTKELGGDGLVLAYLKTINDELVPATGTDLLIEDMNTSFAKYATLAKKVTLTEMMNALLPEIFTVLYSPIEREAKFPGITVEKIMRATGLYEKIVKK